MNWKKSLPLIVALSLAVNYSSAAEIPIAVQPALQQAGSVNAQNIDRVMNLEKERKIRNDVKQFEKRKKSKKETKVEEVVLPEEVQKAKIEEYATKGVYIENIMVSPSEILSENELSGIINKYLHKNLLITDIKKIVREINTLYITKGFVTARAYLPEQDIENGTIKIELAEGKVGVIHLSGNKWTRDNYITDRLDIKSGKVLDVITLEQSILNYNRYNDGSDISLNLNPGQADLTTDIDVKVKEQFPFHFALMYDNAGRQTIGKQRGGVMLQHDSLFGLRDKLTLGSYFTRHSSTPFADYNIPVNKKDGRVGFMFSSSYADIANDPYKMFNINSRSYNYSLYFNQPITRKPYMELASTSSLNYKQATTSFDGYDLNTDKITSAQTGLNFRYDSKKGIWFLNQNFYYAFPIFDPDLNYFKFEGGVLRLHDFGHGIVGQFRGNYQVSPTREVIPYIDQFVAGGISSVRGFSEGLLIGRTGYFLSGELMFPIMPSTIKIKDKKSGEKKSVPFLGKFVKGAVFIDHAGVFPYKGSGPGAEGYNSSDLLLSAGLGLRISLPNSATARLYWGFPLMQNKNEVDGNQHGRFHFEITFAPNIDKLLELRRPKNIEKI